MTPAEIKQYVGKAYALGADGPDAFDCRGLVCTVLREHFSRSVPQLPVGSDMGALWEARVASGDWETVDRPAHGDAVVMRGGDDPHVGVYLTSAGKGVLHAYASARQVVWTPFDRLRAMGFSRLAFVRCHVALHRS